MADPLSRKKAKDGPAEGCLGLGFKGQMNREGGAAPRTPPPGKAGGERRQQGFGLEGRSQNPGAAEERDSRVEF